MSESYMERIRYVSAHKWLIFIVLTALLAGMGITGNWLYCGVLAAPFLLYLFFERPFLFPLGAYVFLLPFDSVLSITGNGAGSTLTKVLGMASAASLLANGLLRRRFTLPRGAALWWMLFILYGAVSILWAKNFEEAVDRMPTALSLLGLYLVAASFRVKKKEYDLLKWAIIAGGVLSALYSIYSYKTGVYDDPRLRASILIGGRYTDPNQFAFSILLPVALCLGTLLKTPSIRKKAFYGASLLIMIYGVVVTGSRGSLLATAVMIAFYLLSIKQKISFGIAAGAIAVIMFSFVPDFFIHRIGQAEATGGAGRLFIWEVGLHAVKKYWLFGVGLSNFYEAYMEFVNYGPAFRVGATAPHNIYLDAVVSLGTPGILLMLAAMGKHYQLLKARFTTPDMEKTALKAAFWGTLAASFFLDTIWRKSFWLLWMMMAMNRNLLPAPFFRRSYPDEE